MTMQWNLWSGLRVRLVSSVGAEIMYWTPLTRPMKVLPDYEPEFEDRVTAGNSNYATLAGFRAGLTLSLLVEDGRVEGSGLSDDLEDVLAGLASNTDSYLEIALHATVGQLGWDWKRVNWTNGWKPQPFKGKAVAMEVTLTFEAAETQLTIPKLDNGGTW